MRRCPSCDELKDWSGFYKRQTSKSGYDSTCKECAKARSRAHHAANKEEKREAARARYQANKAHVKEKAAAWAAANPERRLEIVRKSAEKCRSTKRAYNAAYIQRLKIEDPERLRAQYRKGQAVRRARLMGSGAEISQEWWNFVLQISATGACLYCGNADRPLTVDHWVPVSKGGATEIGNLLPCCKPCNSSKGAMSPVDWRRKLGLGDGASLGASFEDLLRMTREVYEEMAA